MKKTLPAVLLVLALLTTVAAPAQELPKPTTGQTNGGFTTRSYDLVGVGSLQLRLPADWHDVFGRTVQLGVLVDEFNFHAQNTNEFSVAMFVDHLTVEQVRDFNCRAELAKPGNEELPGAEEKSLNLVDIAGAEFSGCYFTLTDKSVTAASARPGEYKYLTHGFVKSGSLVINFRVVSNRAEGPERGRMLEVIKTARVLPKK